MCPKRALTAKFNIFGSFFSFDKLMPLTFLKFVIKMVITNLCIFVLQYNTHPELFIVENISLLSQLNNLMPTFVILIQTL
jgi:hypothetical protein